MVVEILLWTPLAATAVWWALAGNLVARDRYRTWTELFFLAVCFFTGAYAFSDFVFFSVPGPSQASAAAVASLTAITFLATFFMLYGIVLYTKMRNGLLLALVPAGAFLVLIPRYVLVGVVSLEGTGRPYLPAYDLAWFTVWIVYIQVEALVGIVTFYLTYRVVAPQSATLRRRMRTLFLAVISSFILGSLTNTVSSLAEAHELPLFSTFLVLPGLVAFYALSPAGTEPFLHALRRWKARRYEIVGAYLVYQDGTVMGSRSKPTEAMVDQDLFGGMLDLISNFVRSSFELPRSRWLKSIVHGDYTIVMERGKHVYLSLILRGEETDPLRRQMRNLLLAFEERNRTILDPWGGVPQSLAGVETFLGTFFAAD